MKSDVVTSSKRGLKIDKLQIFGELFSIDLYRVETAIGSTPCKY